MAHGFGAGDQARLSNEPQLFACKCTDSGFLIERIQRRSQRKKGGHPLDDLAEPPALVIGERLVAAPPPRRPRVSQQPSRADPRRAPASPPHSPANTSERRSSEVVRTVIGAGRLIISGPSGKRKRRSQRRKSRGLPLQQPIDGIGSATRDGLFPRSWPPALESRLWRTN
jgi:hypothetical protein